jgi:hypothetical protein
MYERTYGAKVEQTEHLDTKDIARMMRADVKEYKRRGLLPADLKTSIRMARFAGGSSIDVNWSLPGATREQVYRPEALRWFAAGSPCDWEDPATGWHEYRSEKLRDELLEIDATLRKIHQRYNWDGSETMVDYFDVRFYGTVGPAWQWLSDLRHDRVTS